MEESLFHYGVKGMKWGVRRDLKRRSRKGARLKKLVDNNNKSIDKLNRSIAKKQNKIKAHKDANRVFNAYRNHLVKDMSEKDIKQGERYLKTLDILSYPIAAIPVVGMGIVGGIEGRMVDAALDAGKYYRNNQSKKSNDEK